MRVGPVSGDLLVKLALMGIGVGVAVWAVRRMQDAVSGAVDSAWGSVDAAAQWVRDGTKYINPASDQNLAYKGVNSVFFPEGDQTLGTWLYDVFRPAPTPEYEFVGPPNIYAGQGNTTSVTPGYTGPGGAAFGMYPRATGGASGSW